MKANLKLKEVEKLIVQSRLKGLSFHQLNEDEIRYVTDKIIIHGSGIVGCAMPSTEGFAEVIHEELVILISDFGYKDLTLDEILLALRLNFIPTLKFPSGVDCEYIPFIGVCFHVDFVAKILAKYMTFRTILDRKFENHIDGY